MHKRLISRFTTQLFVVVVVQANFSLSLLFKHIDSIYTKNNQRIRYNICFATESPSSKTLSIIFKTMNKDILSNLDESVQSLFEWETASIILLLSIDLHSNKIPINITETTGAGYGNNIGPIMEKRHKYWFAPKFVHQYDFFKHINRFCIQNRFKITVESSSIRKAKNQFDRRVVILCI